MVTHGYVVFKYKGIYYTFYNHSDSYFEHLGNLVVDEINSMVNKNAIRYCKNMLLLIPLKGNEEGEVHIHNFHSLLNYPESYQYFTSNKEKLCEYTYTIDFDANKFIANKYDENIYSFNLYDIPLDWYEITQKHSSYDDSDIENNSESGSDSGSGSGSSSGSGSGSEDDTNEDDILNKIAELENKLEKLKLKLSKK
jgi:hypothetical protein